MRFSHTKFQMNRIALALMLLGLLYMIVTFTPSTVTFVMSDPVLSTVLIPLAVVYIALTGYFLVRWIAVNATRKLLAELVRQSKEALSSTNASSVTVQNYAGDQFKVSHSGDTGGYQIELRSAYGGSALLSLTQYALEDYNEYVHQIKVNHEVAEDMATMLKAHNSRLGILSIINEITAAKEEKRQSLESEYGDDAVKLAKRSLPSI